MKTTLDIPNKFTQIRKTIEFHRIATGTKIESGDHYRLDRTYTKQYFDQHEKWYKKICEYFDSLSRKKDKIIHVDICGRTHASNMGSDFSYCFSLRANPFIKKIHGDKKTFFDGDLFNQNDFSSFLKLLKNEKVSPALVTFEPVAGLQTYGPEKNIEGAPQYKEITYKILGKRLQSLIEVLRPGGFIYIERPFQFDADNFVDSFTHKKNGDYVLSRKIKGITRKLKCRVEMNRTIGGVYYLINKPVRQTLHKSP